MGILFLCTEKGPLYRAYTKEQIGNFFIRSWAELQQSPLPETEYIFTTWGMPTLTEAEINCYFPNLKAVFYAAGSVQAFARPFLRKNIRVFSAWAANAVPVAEVAVAQILLANKGFFQLHSRYREGHGAVMPYAEGFPGNYRTTVGLLGAGMIGRYVIQLLKSYNLELLVFDPFLSAEQAKALGVQKADLSEVFVRSQTISNHLANNAQTKGMLDYNHFSRMKPNATFINTGRASQIVTADLFRAMEEEPGRTAVLDVTEPEEPLTPQSNYWKHPNIILTPHRAGSINNEILRMGEFMFAEYEALLQGKNAQYEVTLTMLETMA